jgi:hypothetical protein
MVTEFSVKNEFTLNKRIAEHTFEVDADLKIVADKLNTLGVSLKNIALTAQKAGDERLYRMYLMIEELSETAQGMAVKDEILLADGLADLQYVVSGTAITFGLPMQQLMQEVHNSNMTKKKRDLETNPRMRDKGDEYIPPRIAHVIKLVREIEVRRSKINND